MEYTVIIHIAEEGGYWAEVPALPGCFSQGETVEEILENTREAVDLHIEVLREDGEEVPKDEGLIISRIPVTIS
ncbi:type II toxin-antitoxin system HicB family antitoxin [Candidatus Poribacteria bacterium]